MKNLSQEYLKECFDYNEITGELTKRPRPRSHFKTKRGYVVSLSKVHIPNLFVTEHGYITVSLNNKHLYAHRVIWKMQTGEDPVLIDHIDHDRSNNSWNNLRNIPREDHSKNIGRSKINTSGVTGVHFNKQLKKWVAQCRVNGKTKHIGVFTDIHEASKAVLEAREKNNYHQNHGQEVREARGRWR